jgi:[NiFe] hydrogenase diaphorase moiety small subunit
MSDTITFTIDGKTVRGAPGETILEAADRAGVYIPRLCKGPDLKPRGACRVCTVMVNGRPQSACTQPVAEGAIVENNTPQLLDFRRSVVEMLLVEGNHFCPFCERSGGCELQALAYRLGILAPRYPYQFPTREVDASHPDLMIDRNRCILCGRCVNASRDVDGKTVFEFVGRGTHKRLAVDAEAGLGSTNAEARDKAAAACPVGSIIKKRVGYAVPYGQRPYDVRPIGSEIEVKS